MPQVVAGQVNNPGTTNRADGDNPAPALGRQTDQLVSDYHGRYYTAAYRDRLFHGCSVVAGNSFPIYTSTAIVFGLWNNTTDTNLELVSFKCGYVSGTGVMGPVGYNTKNVGTTVGVPLSAWNPTPAGVRPGKLFSGVSSKASFSNAATNTVVAAAVADWIPSNMYIPVITANDTSNEATTMEEYFDGSFILPPGALWWPANLLASVSLFTMRVTWIETSL